MGLTELSQHPPPSCASSDTACPTSDHLQLALYDVVNAPGVGLLTFLLSFSIPDFG